VNEQSQYLIQAVRGPVILITVGVLFTIDRFTEFHFSETWPILLIVIGMLKLLGGGRRRNPYYPPPPGGAGMAPPPPGARP
jgi:hypothetical protein